MYSSQFQCERYDERSPLSVPVAKERSEEDTMARNVQDWCHSSSLRIQSWRDVSPSKLDQSVERAFWLSSCERIIRRTPASVNTVPTISAEETALSNAILQRVNGLLAPDAAAQRERGRLFAVVHLGGKQYKVTQEDLVRVQQREFPADIGDRIRLEKVCF